MKRRDFLNKTGSTALGLSLFPPELFAKNHSEKMTARELNTYLRSLVEVEEPSVDKIIVGEGKAGPITLAIQKRFLETVKGEAPDDRGWLTPVG